MTRRRNLRVADLGQDSAALSDPRSGVDEWPPDTPDVVRDNVDVLATTIAQAVGAGGGRPEGSLVDDVVAVLRAVSHHWLWLPGLDTTIGPHDQPAPLAAAVADLVGDESLAHLVARPIADLDPPGDGVWWGCLSAMAHALLDPARNGWLDAATARAEHVVAHHQRTDARRHASTGLVDLGGTALCRLALVAGMPLPDHPVFAAGLLHAL